ncbi:MAG: MCP four helix bundle domain-containing protein [Herbaspirillum sp.]|nr:MCP four helix bundle domain-containing protein [Herbaspirillum sp.]
MDIKNIRISTRLTIAFSGLLVVMGIIAVAGLIGLYSAGAATKEIVDEHYARIALATDIRSSTNSAARTLRSAMLARSEAEMDEFLAQTESVDKDATTGLLALAARAHDTERGSALFKLVNQAHDDYVDIEKKMVELVRQQEREVTTDYLFDRLVPRQKSYLSALDNYVSYQRSLMDESVASGERVISSAVALMISLAVLAILFCAISAWLVTRSITRPLNQAVDVASAVAKGDLTMQITATSRDETGLLLAALHAMRHNLHRIVTEVRHGSDTISSTSDQLAAGNQDLSARTEQQAGAVEETASAMDELTATVRQNADNARQADTLASKASEIAMQGGSVVSQVVQTMGEINEASRKIVDIISVIDGIAFQTNILALNAAVEASRAGEQGRGFAVVAAEVRTLAQRSAMAAREIKELIDDSVARVDNGSRLVERAGATMAEVVASVKSVSHVVGEIAAASQEQGDGIGQIAGSIAQMDKMTQQNAALVEEAAAAAGLLQEQSQRLGRTVSVFKLHDVQIVATAPKAVPPLPPTRIAARPASAGVPAKAVGVEEAAWEQF